MLAGEKAKSETHAMAVDIDDDLDKKSKEAMKRECANWRRVWDYLDDDVKSFLMRIGEEVIIQKRDGKAFEGTYGRPIISVVAHEFITMERLHSALHKKMLLYKTNSRVPLTNIVDFKFVEATWEDPTDNQYLQSINAETGAQVDSMQANKE